MKQQKHFQQVEAFALLRVAAEHNSRPGSFVTKTFHTQGPREALTSASFSAASSTSAELW